MTEEKAATSSSHAASLFVRPRIAVLRPHRAASVDPVSLIAFVGGTSAGKTTLARVAAAHPLLKGCCRVPSRCSTRPARRGDAADKTVCLSRADFDRLAVGKDLLLSWERPMPDGSTLGYGCFASAAPGVVLLVAGHGIYTNPSSVRPVGILDRAVLVGVTAPREVRRQRLFARSPDVVSRGVQVIDALLAHDDALMTRKVDVLVRNFDVEPHALGDELAVLIASWLTR